MDGENSMHLADGRFIPNFVGRSEVKGEFYRHRYW
jgi:hypothetical protein